MIDFIFFSFFSLFYCFLLTLIFLVMKHDHQEILNLGCLLLGSLEILRIQLKGVLGDLLPKRHLMYSEAPPSSPTQDQQQQHPHYRSHFDHSLSALVLHLPPSASHVSQTGLHLHCLIVKFLNLFAKLRQLTPRISKIGALYENDRLKKEWVSLAKELE